MGIRIGYIAGATAVHDRAQVLVDFMQELVDFPPAQSKSAMSEWIDKYRYEACSLLQKWKGEVEPLAKQIEYMPIHPEDAKKFDCPTQFPMHLLDEDQAQRNHSQSLKRLKERGGLSVHEILAVAGKKPYSYYGGLPWNEALKMLNDIVITNPQK